jgi:hypothetical protein
MHILAALPGKNSRFALRQFSRRALRCGGMVPEKISNAPLPNPHPPHRIPYAFPFLPNAGSIRIIAATMKPGIVETRTQRKKPE